MVTERHAVTGAFGYSGRYITERLLEAGCEVVTLTNTHPQGDPLSKTVRASPLRFHDHDELCRSLEGVDVLHNTYWVRFTHRRFSHGEAVRNTKRLFEAAREAGVNRIIHVSITNPAKDSPLDYFSGKAHLEEALRQTGIPHTILRPAVLFGKEDILINNIAWMLRRFPVFGVFGDGEYRLQPIFVDDLARLAVEHGSGEGNVVVEAIGPETFTYRSLVSGIGEVIGCHRPIVSLPPPVAHALGWVMGAFLRDVVITKDEIRGLMEGRLYVEAPPAGTTALTEWAREHREVLGREYANELARRTSTASA
jgi:NADH dehydrogenase